MSFQVAITNSNQGNSFFTPQPNYISELGNAYGLALACSDNPKACTQHYSQTALVEFVKNSDPFFSPNFSSEIPSYIFHKLREALPYITTLAIIVKNAIKEVSEDLVQIFIKPLVQEVENGRAPQSETIAGCLFGVILLSHQVALHLIKEDPSSANSITRGATIGLATAYFTEHDLAIGTLSGATIGLITDAAATLLLNNPVNSWIKKQCRKIPFQEIYQKTQKQVNIVVPKLIFATGTALIYQQIKPLVKVATAQRNLGEKELLLKTLALSGMLYGTIQSYCLPLLDSAWHHVKVELLSAYKTGTLFSYIPKVLAVSYLTSYLALKFHTEQNL